MTRSPSPAEVRIGLVGCGRAAGSLHLPALAQVHGVRLAALADVDAGRLSALLAQCPGAAGHADYRALLDDPGIDLVAVCVPASLHAEIAIAALRAGKHLFVEKPLALTLEECNRLVAEATRAEAAGVRSTVGFNLRSHRLMRQAKAILAAGALGEIELVRTLWTANWTAVTRPSWHSVRDQGGGALIEIGTHLADLWRWLLDSEVETVEAMSRSSAFDDQTVTLQARMANGILVGAAVSQRSVAHNVLEVLGSGGSLRVSSYHADSLEVATTSRPESGLRRRLRPLLQRASRLPAALRAASGGGDFKHSYVHQWRRIVAALADGGAMPASTEDGRQAARIVAAARQSAEEGSVPVAVLSRPSVVLETRTG
jgi:myo-inositol 2-dehydrogenase / D-chiro-inositol 1-dehydrogenase